MCVMFLHYISGEKIKTTRDQVTNSLTFQFQILYCRTVWIVILRLFLLNMKCHYFIKDCILLLN